MSATATLPWMLQMPELPVKLLPNYRGPKDAVLTPAYEDDAGVDLYATERIVLLPGERKKVGTGIAMAIPQGWEGQIRPKSGNSDKRGLEVYFGTIDSPYRGELGVVLQNSAPVLDLHCVDTLLECLRAVALQDNVVPVEVFDSAHANHIAAHTLTFEPGQKIAQLVFARFGRPKRVVLVGGELDETARGEKGYGSMDVGFSPSAA